MPLTRKQLYALCRQSMAETEAKWGVRIGLISDSWKWDDKPAHNDRRSSEEKTKDQG